MSTNISKEKRERLVQKINAIKTYISSAAQDENTAQLLTYIADIEKDIKGKKYGLVFEEHREGIDELLENNLPVLTEDTDLFIDNGGQMNFLIEGDNLASLKLLEKTHKGRIDLIYIDPPYNTGNKDFVYDDMFVDSNDTFRHSKWLSFMEKRLAVAKKLLSNMGVIFISIDDNEYATLKVLCDTIFGENSYVATLPRRTINSGKHDSTAVTISHDYVLVYSYLGKSIKLKQKTKSTEEKLSLYNLSDEYVEIRGRYYITQLNKNSIQYSDSLNYPIIAPNGEEIWAGGGFEDKQWVWRWSKAKFQWGLENGFIVFKLNKKTNKYKVYTKSYENVDKDGNLIIRTNPNTSLDFSSNEFTNFNATPELEKIMGAKKIFDYPKPIILIKSLIELLNLKSYTVLDFFAGSGTTGHAVMKLNAEDSGSRKFILCTNNENNICRDVTYERIKRVIAKENYNASLKYFKVDYLPISDKLYYEYADELLLHIRELVELENGINFNGNAEIAIVLTEKELDNFTKNIPETCKAIYVGHDVLPTEEQEKIFAKRKIKVNVIPEYYYRDLEG